MAHESPIAEKMRRGLPRVVGGSPWPLPVDTEEPTLVSEVSPPGISSSQCANLIALQSERITKPSGNGAPVAPPQEAYEPEIYAGLQTRQGLPRLAAGPPWPPARNIPQEYLSRQPEDFESIAPNADETFKRATERTPTAGRDENQNARNIASKDRSGVLSPILRRLIIVVLGTLTAGLILVLLARGFVASDTGRNFLAVYPGIVTSAAGDELLATGATTFPPWIKWQHFMNAFLMVMIIRTGISIKTDPRPTAFITLKKNQRKITLSIWFHQVIDIFWLINGAIFVVLLFLTGNWQRIVPTSWDVFPNAISAFVQYGSLNWPTDHGWAHYNGLQQIVYFTTVFIAAPLAMATGFRLSGMWPSGAEKFSRLYPLSLARSIHFPVMLYFVVFIVTHVAMVFATSALKNLNHMYGTDHGGTWVGFWMFCASACVMVLGWLAIRPIILAPLAGLFGKVSR